MTIPKWIKQTQNNKSLQPTSNSVIVINFPFELKENQRRSDSDNFSRNSSHSNSASSSHIEYSSNSPNPDPQYKERVFMEAAKKVFPMNQNDQDSLIENIETIQNSQHRFEINHQIQQKEKIKYFKIDRKRGKRRIRGVSIIHDKNSTYNIICKIKVYFTKAVLNQANNLYTKNQAKNQNSKDFLFQPVAPKNEEGENNQNFDWFFKTAKEYLSSNLSKKCTAHDKDFNKRKIEEIYEENKMKDLINFLNQKNSTIFKEYISPDKSENEIFQGMRKIQEDLETIMKSCNGDEHYKTQFKKIYENLENILNKKKKGMTRKN